MQNHHSSYKNQNALSMISQKFLALKDFSKQLIIHRFCFQGIESCFDDQILCNRHPKVQFDTYGCFLYRKVVLKRSICQ